MIQESGGAALAPSQRAERSPRRKKKPARPATAETTSESPAATLIEPSISPVRNSNTSATSGRRNRATVGKRNEPAAARPAASGG
jgi:hypothetical protein